MSKIMDAVIDWLVKRGKLPPKPGNLADTAKKVKKIKDKEKKTLEWLIKQ